MLKPVCTLLVLFLIYAGCNNSDTVIDVIQNGGNLPPRTPYNPTPHDSLTVAPGTHIEFLWSGGDPNTGDTAKYDLYLDTIDPPADTLVMGSIAAVYDLGIPAPGTYFWRVVSKDLHGSTANGPVWRFTVSP